MLETLNNLATELLNTNTCLTCQNQLSDASEHKLCQSCNDSVEIAPTWLRMKTIDVVGLTSYSNKVVQRLLNHIKFNGDRQSLRVLQHLIKKTNMSLPEIDFCIPIPLHHKRLKQRGFNQSKELFMPFCEENNLTMYSLLTRERDTIFLSHFENKDRKKHLNGCYSFSSKLAESVIIGQTVLLVDDIVTTGSTFEEAQNMLLKAGAKKVYGCAVAH